MKLFFHEFGNGRPLIILHGLFGDGGNWRSLAKDAFGKRYRVLIPDQRNHGRSPHSPHFSYEDMADDLREFMDAHAIERAFLMGHSMGGKTAMRFALSWPERVDRLVVLDIAPIKYSPRNENTLRALRRVDPASFDKRTDIEAALGEIIQDPRTLQFLMKNVKRATGGFRWRFNLEAIESGYRSIRESVHGWQPFEGEALFVRGGKSDYIQDRDLPHVRNEFPRARFRTIESAGHWVHVDAPEQLSEIVLGFLGEDNSGTG